MLESPFNKVAGCQAWNFIKKRRQHGCFLVNIAKFLRTPILKIICERLLLNILKIFQKFPGKSLYSNTEVFLLTF